MVEVDLKKIRSVISNYSDILKQLEDNNTVIIHKFDELSRFWNDHNRVNLSSSFNMERQRILRLEGNVKAQQAIYKYLEKEYEKIGRKVKCNLDSRDLLNSKLDSIIKKIENIIDRYDNLGDISFYSRAYLIYEQKKEMKVALNSFKTIKKDLNKKFKQISNIEKQVSDLLNAIKVETFVANNYESEGYYV